MEGIATLIITFTVEPTFLGEYSAQILRVYKMKVLHQPISCHGFEGSSFLPPQSLAQLQVEPGSSPATTASLVSETHDADRS